MREVAIEVDNLVKKVGKRVHVPVSWFTHYKVKLFAKQQLSLHTHSLASQLLLTLFALGRPRGWFARLTRTGIRMRGGGGVALPPVQEYREYIEP